MLTYIIIILYDNNSNTWRSSGKGKVELGVLSCLPMNLQSQKTYAVVNSVRTVNCIRFSSVFDAGLPVEPRLDNEYLKIAFKSIMSDMTYNSDNRLKVDVFKELHINSSINTVNDLLYDLLRSVKSKCDKKVIANIKMEIVDIMIYIPYKILYLRIDDVVKPLARQVFTRNFFKIVLTKLK